MALQATSVCPLSVTPQDRWLPWSSGIAFGCLCTCVVQHFPLITSHPPASTSGAVSVQGGRGHAPPHQCQHIQCTVTWFLSEFPAADEAATAGQLQQKIDCGDSSPQLPSTGFCSHSAFQSHLFQGNVYPAVVRMDLHYGLYCS